MLSIVVSLQSIPYRKVNPSQESDQPNGIPILAAAGGRWNISDRNLLYNSISGEVKKRIAVTDTGNNADRKNKKTRSSI
jgi:hypothetical protein